MFRYFLARASKTSGLVSSTSSGIVPKIAVSSTTINNQANDWILTSTSGNTPVWKKLPTSAFCKYIGTTELQTTAKVQELTGIKNIMTYGDHPDYVTASFTDENL